jgi:hypothetical protein
MRHRDDLAFAGRPAAKRTVGDNDASAFGGAVGGGMLAAANRFLVAGARWIAPTIVGAALGPLVLLHDAGPVLGRLLFYMIWQGGYAAALAVAFPTSQRAYQAKKR